MPNPHVIKLLIIVAFLSLSAISWVLRKLKEQSDLKRVQTEHERRRDQLLRTGRAETDQPMSASVTGPATVSVPPTTPAGAMDARRLLQELAQRRQQQLNELRRRQMQQQGQVRASVAPPRPPPPTTQAPRPAVPIRRASVPPPAPPRLAPIPPQRRSMPTPQAPASAQSSYESAQDRKRRIAQERAARAAAAQQASQRAAAQERQAAALSAATPHKSPLAAPPSPPPVLARLGLESMVGAAPGKPTALLEWQRALVMMELLGPPVALRDAGQGPTRPIG